MSDTKYTIWFINKADEICLGEDNLDNFLLKNDLKEDLKDFKHRLIIGNRPKLNLINPNAPVKEVKRKHNLMLEDKIDEYYVEVALKCLGDKDVSTNAKGQELLDAIRDPKNNEVFRPDKFRKYWEYSEYRDKKFEVPETIKMATPDYMGYYEILEKTKPNILIAYSQGGLVAWYLSFLEEKIFNPNKEKDPVIAGFISLSSPNYGSPLANPENAGAVTLGICDILKEFSRPAQKEPVPRGIENYVKKINTPQKNKAKPELKFKHIFRLMDTLGNLIKFPLLEDIAATIRTFRKWTFGLDREKVNAFDDLIITNILKPEEDEFKEGIGKRKYSVLNLLHKEENLLKKTPFLAVAGGNNNISEIIQSLFPKKIVKKEACNEPKKCLKNMAKIEKAMKKAKKGMDKKVLKAKLCSKYKGCKACERLFNSPFKNTIAYFLNPPGLILTLFLRIVPQLVPFSKYLLKLTKRGFWRNLYLVIVNLYKDKSDVRLEEVSRIFKKGLLLEDKNSDRKDRIQAYMEGEAPILSYAHDCVVPSVNQLIPGESSITFADESYCNNEKANHNSGKSSHFSGGQFNLERIIEFIKLCMTYWDEKQKGSKKSL